MAACKGRGERPWGNAESRSGAGQADETLLWLYTLYTLYTLSLLNRLSFSKKIPFSLGGAMSQPLFFSFFFFRGHA